MNQWMGSEIQSALVNGATLSWREAGAGDDVIVFIHGFPFNSAIWQAQLDAAPPGWRMIAPDLRGFGGSGPVPADRLSMDTYADDVAALIRFLDVGRAVVCGHSMGGYVTFALLRRHAAIVRGLVLCDTRAEPDSTEGREGRLKNAKHVRANGTAALIDAMVPRLLSSQTRAASPRVEQQVRDVMKQATPVGVVGALHAMAERPDSTPQLRSINVQTLLIVGEQDQITTVGDARLLARAIPGSRLEIVPGAGHLPGIERTADFNRVLFTFLDAVRAG